MTNLHEFIESLELAEAPMQLLRTKEAKSSSLAIGKVGHQAAQVNAGSLVSFVGGLSEVNRADVQNSTLLAQLAANKKFPDKVKHAKKWFDFYSDVLQKVGWNMPAWTQKDLSRSSGTLQLDTVVLELVATIMTGTEVAIIKAAMDALKATADGSKQMTIWNQNTGTSKGGMFQILPCAQSAEGNVVMALSAIQYQVSEQVDRFLWMSWSSSSIKVQGGAAKVELNTNVYSKVRDSVVAKLGVDAGLFVAGLDI